MRLHLQEDVSDLMEHEHDDDEDTNGKNDMGGYTFDTEEHKAALKAQRAQLWQCACILRSGAKAS